MEDRYEREINTLRLENESLRKSLVLLENQKHEEMSILKQRYLMVPEERQEEIRKSYQNDITKTLMDLDTANLFLNEKER